MRAPSTAWPSSYAPFVLMAVVACGPSAPIAAPAGDDDDEMQSEGSSGSTGTVPDEPEASSSSGSEEEPPSSFIEAPDGGNGFFECDLYIQDCPSGNKCNPWAADGGTYWNATRCVPIADDPDGAGEPCTVDGSATSGLDSCGLGAMCWEVDAETNTGVCREFCEGGFDNPVCADPETLCGGPRDFPLCLPVCCPVEQDCPEGQGCYPVSYTFECAPDASGEIGTLGDPCEYINACDTGYACMGSSMVPDCGGTIGCCTPFCLVGTTTCSDLDPRMECSPWYEEDRAPHGYELTGVCVLTE